MAMEHSGSELVPQVCPTCGIVYAIQSSLHELHKQDKKSWSCPNGHEIVYTVSEAEGLRKQLESANKSIEFLHGRDESMRRTISNLYGQITKLKKAGK